MSTTQKELNADKLHLAAAYRLAETQALPGIDILHLAVRTGAGFHLSALARLSDTYFGVLWRETELAFTNGDPNTYPAHSAIIGGACLRYTAASSALAHTIRCRAQGNRSGGPGDETWNVLVSGLTVAYRRHATAGNLATLTVLVDDIADSIGTL